MAEISRRDIFPVDTHLCVEEISFESRREGRALIRISRLTKGILYGSVSLGPLFPSGSTAVLRSALVRLPAVNVMMCCLLSGRRPGYGQTAELHALMAHGASMGISRGVTTLLDELAEIKPTLLYAVPQLFKRVCDAIHAKV